MAIVKTGTFTVTAGGTAQNLTLGFIPSYFYAKNLTNVITPANNELISFEWFDTMANGTAMTIDYTASQPAIEQNYLATNGVTPFQTTDALLYVPNQAPYTDATRVPMGASTNLKITAITRGATTSVAATHSFTAADIGVTSVTFHYCSGMSQINTLSGVIQSVTSTTDFTVNIDSTNFTAYVNDGKGMCNVVTGAPASTTQGFQIFNTPLKNLGVIGLTFGTSLMITTADVWLYEAVLDAPFTS